MCSRILPEQGPGTPAERRWCSGPGSGTFPSFRSTATPALALACHPLALVGSLGQALWSRGVGTFPSPPLTSPLPQAPEPSSRLCPRCHPLPQQPCASRARWPSSGAPGTGGIGSSWEGSRSSTGLTKLGGTPNPSAQAGGVRFEGSPELDRERVPLGVTGSRSNHLPSDVPETVRKALRSGRIPLKPELLQRQPPAERRAAWPSFPKGVQRPEARGQRSEP